MPEVTKPKRARFHDAAAVIKQPKIAFVLVIIASGLQALNTANPWGAHQALKTTITILIGGFTTLGVGPLVGPKFRAFVHVGPKLAGVIGLVLLSLMVVVQQQFALPEAAIVQGILNFCAGLGFTPAYIPML